VILEELTRRLREHLHSGVVLAFIDACRCDPEDTRALCVAGKFVQLPCRLRCPFNGTWNQVHRASCGFRELLRRHAVRVCSVEL
jgi:hypothetical protein